jgi:hypothetical protein
MVQLPSYGMSTYEEPQNGSQCIGYSYRDESRSYVDGNGQVQSETYSVPYCP